jgi:hypothetical protein
MDDELKKLLAVNEAAFREVNEGIERGQWPGEEDAPISFRCECARLGCNELVELSVRQYERARSDPRRFIVMRGHERPEIEVVVDQIGACLIVEKVDQAAATAAEMDPRRPESPD